MVVVSIIFQTLFHALHYLMLMLLSSR